MSTSRKLTIWALFDSGKGAYSRALTTKANVISIGLDKTKKSTGNFINLNLADYSSIFGNNILFDTLDQLPSPDIILASPPCESWSIASAMKGGNAFYTWSKNEPGLKIRTDEEITSKNHTPFKHYPDKTLYTRINGELRAFNTIEIIQRYMPKVWVIENPRTSRIFDYLQYYHGFVGLRNITNYNNYNENFPKKPTCFLSNINLHLVQGNKPSKIGIHPSHTNPMKTDYNLRSDIPDELIIDIFGKISEKMEAKQWAQQENTKVRRR